MIFERADAEARRRTGRCRCSARAGPSRRSGPGRPGARASLPCTGRGPSSAPGAGAGVGWRRPARARGAAVAGELRWRGAVGSEAAASGGGRSASWAAASRAVSLVAASARSGMGRWSRTLFGRSSPFGWIAAPRPVDRVEEALDGLWPCAGGVRRALRDALAEGRDPFRHRSGFRARRVAEVVGEVWIALADAGDLRPVAVVEARDLLSGPAQKRVGSSSRVRSSSISKCSLRLWRNSPVAVTANRIAPDRSAPSGTRSKSTSASGGSSRRGSAHRGDSTPGSRPWHSARSAATLDRRCPLSSVGRALPW